MRNSRTSTQTVLLALIALVGCGSPSPDSLVCPSEMHAANPDGRGARCIDDRSTCGAADDCVAEGPCCQSECKDSGDGVYACVEACSSPDCTAGSCSAGSRCQQGLDECTAYCVPDSVECPDGSIPADPDGTGNFVCVRSDSECLSSSDCPQDPCCPATCVDGGDSRYVCETSCLHGGDGADADADVDGEADIAPDCQNDSDCESMWGPGYTCSDQCGGSVCVPPPAECQVAADCMLAIDTSECCPGCAQAVARSQVGPDSCWVETQPSQRDRGDDGNGMDAPIDCTCRTNIACPEIGCVDPVAVDCMQGQCVAIAAYYE